LKILIAPNLMPSKSRPVRDLLRLGALVLISACQAGTTTTPEGQVPTTITITSSSIDLTFLGQTAPVGITVRDQSGQTMGGQTIEWLSSDPAVFTITGALVAAVANGTATLTASSGGLNATATVTVQQIATGVAIVSGLSQDAINGTALAEAIVAQARDAGGAAVAGATVTFTPAPDNGSVSVGSGTTDSMGELSTTWTLGMSFGPQTLVAASGSGTAEVNAFSRSINPLPDLVINDALRLSRYDPTNLDEFTVRATVKNNGDDTTGTGFRVQVLDGANNQVGAADVPAMESFTEIEVEVTVGPMVVGETTLTVVADPDDAVTELLENNNESSRGVTVKNQSIITLDKETSYSASLEEEVLFRVDIAGPATLTVELIGGTGDADLFVEHGERPSGRAGYDDCLSFSPGSDESCQIGFADGEYNILVHGCCEGQGAGPVNGAKLNVTVGEPLQPFNIDIVFEANGTESQDSAMIAAAARWAEIIVADVHDVNFINQTVPEWCVSSKPVLNQVVDDVLIYVKIVAKDGPGGTLASAGPCFTRQIGGIPIIGRMEFDEADLQVLENNNQLFPVILHEMGHVLGIGTLWNRKDLLRNPSLDGEDNLIPNQDTHFLGERAIVAFDANGGDAYVGAKVPVENASGSGSGDSHWRESVMTVELMTPRLNSALASTLSSITVGSLFDLGYSVDMSQADSYQGITLAPPRAPGIAGVSPSFIDLSGDVFRGPIAVVDENGRIVRVLR
jgi:hypothetical protein